MTEAHDSEYPHGVDPRVIEKARKLDARDASSGWSWGRLALEAVPHYQRGRHDDGALTYFADETGWTDSDRSVDTLREYRAAAPDWSMAEVRKWPGLTIDSARRLGRREDRDAILSACAMLTRAGGSQRERCASAWQAR